MMRAYGRRHRRWQKRNTAPLMLVADSGGTAELIEAVARLLHRYRSELAPFSTAAGLAGGGLILHLSYPTWWPAVLSAAGGMTALIATTGAPVRSERMIERVYAGLVTSAAGGWLAAAVAAGPWHQPLPALLGIGSLVAGIPWWTHRRRRMRVRVDRAIQAWPEVAEAIGLTGSRVMSAIVDLWGWRGRFSLRPGQTVADVVAHVPAIESGLGTRPGAVRVEPDPAHAGRFMMRVLANDPHATVIAYPGASVGGIAEPITLGVFEDGSRVRVCFLRRNSLIGGLVGSGKSGVLNVVIANLVACPDAVLWGIDLKGGMELRPWASCFDRIATTPADAAALMRDAVRIVEARARAMERSAARLWEPRAERPALIIVIDEYAELAEHADGAAESADSVARRGRAVAVTLLAATQRPTQRAMGSGAVRSQMDIRISLRVRERRDVDLILGQGMLTAGWTAQTLDAPGKFLLAAEGHDIPRRARAYLVTDDDVRREAARWAGERPRLDVASADALSTAQQVARGLDDEICDAQIVEDSLDPDAALWAALCAAPDGGTSVPELMITTGMGRTWIYDRLQHYAIAGRAIQTARGRWRAADEHRDHSAA